jgi:hypothetical protein
MPFFKKNTVAPKADAAAKPIVAQIKTKTKITQIKALLASQTNPTNNVAHIPRIPAYAPIQSHLIMM